MEQSVYADIIDQFVASTTVNQSAEVEYCLIKDLVDAFDTAPVLSRRAMRELLTRSPGRFYAAAVQVLRESSASPGHDYLVGLLVENDLLLVALMDPDAVPDNAAVALAKSLAKLDSHLDSKLMQRLFREGGNGHFDAERGFRILEIVDAVSDGTRVVQPLMKLLQHGDKRFQSKAARLLSRSHRNVEWLATLLGHADSRVRANLLEGLFDRKLRPREIELAKQAARDENHRVATTALALLHMSNDRDAAGRLVNLAIHPTPVVRAAAAWAMGRTGDHVFLEVLQKMIREDTGSPKRMALKGAVILRKIEDNRSVEEAVKADELVSLT